MPERPRPEQPEIRPRAEPRAEPRADEPLHRPWLAWILVAGLLAVLAIGCLRLPRESAALPDIARQAMDLALPKWGTTEPVNEIVYGTRGFDTFGETFLLLAAVVSVSTLARGREPRAEYVGEASAGRDEQRESDPHESESPGQSEARSAERAEQDNASRPVDADQTPLGSPGPEQAEAMTVVVRIAARSTAVILAVAAVYLAAWGYSPGGGFPAGAALSGVAVLLYAALGYRRVRRVVRPSVLEPLELAGAAAIIGIELVGLLRKGSFSANWVPLAPVGTIRSGGILQPFSGSELIEVGTGLTIVIFSLLAMGHDWTPDENEDTTDDAGDDSGQGGGEQQ
jgi:multicomponent Na+:H+ antiporter subunit B